MSNFESPYYSSLVSANALSTDPLQETGDQRTSSPNTCCTDAFEGHNAPLCPTHGQRIGVLRQASWVHPLAEQFPSLVTPFDAHELTSPRGYAVAPNPSARPLPAKNVDHPHAVNVYQDAEHVYPYSSSTKNMSQPQSSYYQTAPTLPQPTAELTSTENRKLDKESNFKASTSSAPLFGEDAPSAQIGDEGHGPHTTRKHSGYSENTELHPAILHMINPTTRKCKCGATIKGKRSWERHYCSFKEKAQLPCPRCSAVPDALQRHMNKISRKDFVISSAFLHTAIMSQHNDELFPSIGSVAEKADKLPETEKVSVEETDDLPTQEVESLCMKCGEQGVTRLLLTSIPYFREVIVMSFRCEHCGASNNEIQSAGTIRPEGTTYTVRVLSRPDLNRQIVRSESCSIVIPEYQLTLPASLRGQLTTIEGLIRDIVADLNTDQPLRKYQDPENYEKIQALIDKLKEILADEEEEGDGNEDGQVVISSAADKEGVPMPPFTLKLDDPAGNSFIEFFGSMADPKWDMKTYQRTQEQNVALGLVAEGSGGKPTTEEPSKGDEETDAPADPNEEVYVFPGVCSSCGHALDTKMKKVSIPYFKDILIMSTNCDRCGYRDNEVKSGAAISPQGKRITLKVEDKEDLSRDILKSETAGLTIPEIDLVLSHGTLGGRFTTLEGILEQVYEELSEKVFASGDSRDPNDRDPFEVFLKNLKEVKNAEREFTLILDDPLANSYVQNIFAPDPDPNMVVEMYDRSWQQNEELGLNDMKVEGYEGDPNVAEDKAKTEDGKFES
ncbi:hypothetical protein ONZ45_g9081 [Pleurotus djamor]|nr:hypothetical protein ONZ45_g9081 [Pleurotus djamor]